MTKGFAKGSSELGTVMRRSSIYVRRQSLDLPRVRRRIHLQRVRTGILCQQGLPEPAQPLPPRAARRAALPAATASPGGERQMYEVICDGCGCTTQVPFQPRGDRPVYCRECFERQRQNNY